MAIGIIARRDMLYEVRYLVAAPALLWIYWQYVVVYQCMNRAKYVTSPVWVPLGACFALQNVAFNAIVGSFIFWEKPAQLFFSDRIRSAPQDRQERYKRLLNPHDPYHI